MMYVFGDIPIYNFRFIAIKPDPVLMESYIAVYVFIIIKSTKRLSVYPNNCLTVNYKKKMAVLDPSI